MRKSNRAIIKNLGEKWRESVGLVLPITVIVLVMSITFVPIEPGPIVLFMFAALFLILGMALFTIGVDMSMIPLGEGIGVMVGKAKNKTLPFILCFILGVLITVAEPDLTVLASQVTSINSNIIIYSVALGVGLFIILALLRNFVKIKLSYILMFLYTVTFVMVIFVDSDIIPFAFDSGGVTTGAVTVPFIMAFGIGIASNSSKSSQADSFGLVALSSIGPILAMLILGILKPIDVQQTTQVIPQVDTVRQAMSYFVHAFPHYFGEVAISLLPIVGVFALFEIFSRRFKRHQLIRIISGFIYTYLGLVLFLTGVNIGFMPIGYLIGLEIANSFKWLLIPVGMVVGYFIVAAEPAVHVLKKQVEEVSNGLITRRAMGIGLSIGVSISVGIAMLRIITGISILWFLIPGYALALGMNFFVPQMFTGVAFDAGGVASGPMTATFLLPLALGACNSLGGSIMSDAFGIVAMVAMTPLVTIQLLGLIGKIRKKINTTTFMNKMDVTDDVVVYFD